MSRVKRVRVCLGRGTCLISSGNDTINPGILAHSEMPEIRTVWSHSGSVLLQTFLNSELLEFLALIIEHKKTLPLSVHILYKHHFKIKKTQISRKHKQIITNRKEKQTNNFPKLLLTKDCGFYNDGQGAIGCSKHWGTEWSRKLIHWDQ